MILFWGCSDESLWTLAPRVILGTTAIAVVYGEIRLRTGSVWPAVVMHASGNAVAAGLLDGNVLVQNETTPWIFSPGIDGLVVLAASAFASVVLLSSRSSPSGPTRGASSRIGEAPTPLSLYGEVVSSPTQHSDRPVAT